MRSNPLTMLIVDDNDEFRSALGELMLNIEPGLEIHYAKNAPEALEVLAMREVHFISSDLEMPGGNGYELMAQLKLKHETIPTFIISGSTKVEVEDLFRFGAKGIYQKDEILTFADMLGKHINHLKHI